MIIDIHTHILHGLDDGAKSLKEAVSMIRLAWLGHVETIVCTPHYSRLFSHNTSERIKRSVESFQDVIGRKGIGIRVLPGAEVSLSCFMDPCNDVSSVQTLNDSRYILVEIPPYMFLGSVGTAIDNITMKGLMPVIAHPERTLPLFYDSKHDRVVRGWIERGALIQITASSLKGGFGRAVKEISWALLKSGLVHIIASDAHSPVHRTPDMFEIFKLVGKYFGEGVARVTMVENPTRIVEDLDIPERVVKTSRGKRTFFFGFFRLIGRASEEVGA